ncbi:class I SAM-dependent methyltransferase [Aestuariivirga sp.]|uniref:class I SAM-dependent methyltransferase n=1 Tax=Aestuariivirga sp. TaxID=2650926 RepID=UPI003BAA3E79
MGKTLGLSGALETYYAAHAYREPPVLAELRQETASLGSAAGMQIGPEQGAFMGLIVKLMGARKVIEFGTFTGYSSLAMALAGAEHITCADVSREYTDIARRFWARAGVAELMDLHLDGGTAVIKRLLDGGEAGHFDLAFIDADKTGYDSYYEGSLKLLRPGGLILVDNTLWDGDVADPKKQDADTNAIRSLNAKILADQRVEICLLPLCDGLTMAQKA